MPIDNQQVKKKRDLTLEKLKSRYPDKQYDDDEALFGQINDDYDDYDQKIKKYQDNENALTDLFTKDPHSAQFLTNWRNGSHPAVELVRQFGPDFVEELKDPERQKDLAEATKEYAERVQKEKEYEDTYQRNIEQSRSDVEALQQEEGLSDEDIDKAMGFLATIMSDGIVGKFTKDTVKMAVNAVKYDDDVALAGEEGEVRGRNSKIETKLRTPKRNDGTADLAGKNSLGAMRQAPEYGALDSGGSANIWERGGEKRRKQA
jgi:hypothetical protein